MISNRAAACFLLAASMTNVARGASFRYEDEKWIVCVFPREKHRPACYTAEGDANLLSSPASVDLGGVFITPVEKDFLKITAEDIAQILSEVSLSAEDFHRVRQRIKEQI